MLTWQSHNLLAPACCSMRKLLESLIHERCHNNKPHPIYLHLFAKSNQLILSFKDFKNKNSVDNIKLKNSNTKENILC